MLWPKCNWLLRLGRPWGAVTLSRWDGWWYMNKSNRRGLNLSSTKLHRPWSPWESSPSRKNPHGRAENRTRDLIISSQKLWPLDHEAGWLSWRNPRKNWQEEMPRLTWGFARFIYYLWT
jgi:hypothetical protein